MSNELRARLMATPAVKLAGVSVGEHGSDSNIKILHSLAQRRRWIQEGKALSDGSFPIPNIPYLRYALDGYEFAENKPKVKRWIVRNAKKFNRVEMLPQSWQGKSSVVAAAGDEDQPEVHTGAMIAIYPPPEIAELLAGPKATDEPAEELHVTLAFLGEADTYDAEARARLSDAIAAALGESEPFEASVQGAGWFVDSGDGAPQWYSVNAPGLARLRSNLVDKLKEFGIELPTEYDFVPHMTVRYGDPSVTEIPAGGEKAWAVESVYLVMAGDRMPFPLGTVQEDVQETPEAVAEEIIETAVDAAEDPETQDEAEQSVRFGTKEDYLAQFAGDDSKLRDYWLRGEGAAKIAWGTDGDFTRCVRNLREHVRDPEGLCAEYHHEATGMWPGDSRNQ